MQRLQIRNTNCGLGEFQKNLGNLKQFKFRKPAPGNAESSGQTTSNVVNQPAAIENAAEAEKNEEINQEGPESSEKAEVFVLEQGFKKMFYELQAEKDFDSNAPTASVVSINHPVEPTSGNGDVSGTEAQSLQPPTINEIPPTNRQFIVDITCFHSVVI